jgi:hypothetical protein
MPSANAIAIGETMKRQNQFKTQPSMPIVQVKAKPESQSEPRQPAAAVTTVLQVATKRQIAIVAAVIGLSIGLLIGWVWWPVEYTGATYEHLTDHDKALLLELAGNVSIYNANDPALRQLQTRWPEIDELACFVAANEQVTEENRTKLTYLAFKMNQTGCR